MKFDYDPETDALYIKVADRNSLESEEIGLGIVLDFGYDGELTGMEIDCVAFNAGPSKLQAALGNLPVDLTEKERKQVNLAFDQVLAGRYKLLDPIG